MRIWPDLGEVLGDLQWAVAGAVGTRPYMPERATGDLDVVIRAVDETEAAARMGCAGYTRTATRVVGTSSWAAPDGTPVDLIAGEEPWWNEALADPARGRDQQGLPVLSLPYLVLMKLLSSRTIDVGDISRMVGLASRTDAEETRKVVQRHAPELVPDLESLIELGRLEFGEPDE
jgi:hypothetical protein